MSTQGDRVPRLRPPENISADQLDPAARAELMTLPSDLADSVARHLVAAGLEEDPERAYQHAQEARRLAARVGVVREACGIAAYRAGHWAEALAELRAARRLTGRESSLPLMADSERALGRLDRALAIVHGPEVRRLDRATQIELRIVESGIRRDQGMPAAALLTLQVPELTDGKLYPWSARLRYAYADVLLEDGRVDEARSWFARAAAADPDGETDAAERFDELDDVAIEDLAEDDEEALAEDAPAVGDDPAGASDETGPESGDGVEVSDAGGQPGAEVTRAKPG
jgi:tetratricopeptide (TPR) repeat protein